MNWNALLDREKRTAYWTRFRKHTRRMFSGPADSRGCFLFGTQRSGTSMLMRVFELHPDTEIYQEHLNSKAFERYRIRDLKEIQKLVRDSKAPFTWFKPIADSHRMREFLEHFPDGRFLWVFRDYADNANSSLRKWTHATRAIRLVCEGKTGGGFFQEGVRGETERILRETFRPTMTDFDLACLAWWGRNRIVTDHGLPSRDDVMFVRYEDLVTGPETIVPSVLRYAGMRRDPQVDRLIHSNSVSRHPHPELHPAVKQLCEDLYGVMKGLAERDQKRFGAAEDHAVRDSDNRVK